MASFDLVDRPWLPCVARDGTAADLSLRQALTGAHDLRELYDPSPLVTVALHRLLLAILHRAYQGPAGMAEWQEIWRAGRFDSALIDGYLDGWRHRFDLFDPERPFYQVPFIADLADPKKQAPVTRLVSEASTGNNLTLFDHNLDLAPEPMSASRAARSVVAAQGFALAGGNSRPFNFSHGPMVAGYSVIAAGASLFETLALNLVPNRFLPPAWHVEDDQPCWEQITPAVPHRAGTPFSGYTDYLTWQSRLVRLIPDESGTTVRWCQIRQNLTTEASLFDPFKCYWKSKEHGWAEQRFVPERALWRDSTVLFQQMRSAHADRDTRRPDLMEWLARVQRARRTGEITARPVYTLRAYGLTTDARNVASVLLWRREELPLPLSVLEEPQAVAAVKRAIDLADAVNRVLRENTRDLATLLLAPMADQKDARKPDPDKAVRPLARSLGIEARFWPLLETRFDEFLIQLPEDRRVDPEGDGEELIFGETTLPPWSEAVRVAARQAFVEGTAGLDRSARALKAVAVARRQFEIRLSRALGSEKGAAAA